MKKLLVVFGLMTACNMAFAYCDDGHWVQEIKETSSGDRIVVLEDGTMYEVDSFDSALWQPIDSVVVCDDKIINTDDGTVSEAEELY